MLLCTYKLVKLQSTVHIGNKIYTLYTLVGSKTISIVMKLLVEELQISPELYLCCKNQSQIKFTTIWRHGTIWHTGTYGKFKICNIKV